MERTQPCLSPCRLIRGISYGPGGSTPEGTRRHREDRVSRSRGVVHTPKPGPRRRSLGPRGPRVLAWDFGFRFSLCRSRPRPPRFTDANVPANFLQPNFYPQVCCQWSPARPRRHPAWEAEDPRAWLWTLPGSPCTRGADQGVARSTRDVECRRVPDPHRPGSNPPSSFCVLRVFPFHTCFHYCSAGKLSKCAGGGHPARRTRLERAGEDDELSVRESSVPSLI